MHSTSRDSAHFFQTSTLITAFVGACCCLLQWTPSAPPRPRRISGTRPIMKLRLSQKLLLRRGLRSRDFSRKTRKIREPEQISPSADVSEPDGHTEVVFAYCHGFLSGPRSSKGLWLKEKLKERFGADLKVLDLNGGPTPASITPETGMQALERLASEHPEAQLRLCGSSLGAYVSALYASRHPHRVDRLTLLCPSFDMPNRFNVTWGEKMLGDWKREGFHSFRTESGMNINVPFNFIECCMKCDPFPLVSKRCPTLIFHGTEDTVVDPSVSERYLSMYEKGKGANAHVMLNLVPDSHSMNTKDTLQTLLKNIEWHWELCGTQPESKETPKATDDTQNAPEKHERKEIEVERKLMLSRDDDCSAAIEKAGGNLIGVQSFADRYWDIWKENVNEDTDSDDETGWLLARNSCWLRQRAGLWELKIPLDKAEVQRTNASAEVYNEILGADAIYHYLSGRWPTRFPPSMLLTRIDNEKFEEILRSWGLSVFASYWTTRTKYHLQIVAPSGNSHTVTVDLDKTQYAEGSSFTLIELEKVVDSPEKIEEAEKDLDFVINTCFGNLRDDKEGLLTRGKLTEFIRRYRPKLYQTLTTKLKKFNHLRSMETGTIERYTKDERNTIGGGMAGQSPTRNSRDVKVRALPTSVSDTLKTPPLRVITDEELGGFEKWCKEAKVRTGPLVHAILESGDRGVVATQQIDKVKL